MENKLNNKDRFRKKVRIFWLVFVFPIFCLILLILLVALGAFGSLPGFEELENPRSNLASEIYSGDGKVIGKYYAENRTNIRYRDLDSNMVHALVATEDARFYKHSGVDGRGLLRVLGRTVLGGDQSGGGGSTITQQLAKMLFGRQKNHGLGLIVQKFKEWVIAARLERHYTKEEIIAMYLNRFDFLYNAVGVKSAAKIYFNTTPASLRPEQSAMLIGMAKNPALFNPKRRIDTTQHRRNVVMSQMVKYGYLSQQKYDSLKKIPIALDFQPEEHYEGIATYFREFLRNEFLKKWVDENPKPDGKKYDIYRDGLRIYTTVDSRMQKYAEEAVEEHMKNLQQKFERSEGKRKSFPFVRRMEGDKSIEVTVEKLTRASMHRSDRYKHMKDAGASDKEIEKSFSTPDTMTIFTWNGERDTVMTPMDSIRYYKRFLQSGFMSMDPHSGFVKAWVGSINYRHFQYDHVQSDHRRQVGSTFKPFVYSLAIMEGWSPCRQVPNVPVTIRYDEKEWTPHNSSPPKLDGKMFTLKKALALSINYITAYLMKEFGPQAVVKIVKQMGITSQVDPYPSICLGTPDISVFEMVGAYSTFANKGTRVDPVYVTRIEDKNGKVLWEFIPKRTEVMEEDKAYVMLELMKGVTLYGTGAALRGEPYRFPNAIAGKTGTTQHNADGWFMGITPDLVSGGWVGGEDPVIHFTNMAEGQGSTMALPIWGLYMKKVYADKTLKISKGDFEKPAKKIDLEMDCTKYDKDDDETEIFDNAPVPDEDKDQ